ncbi:2,4-dichlorophenol 6-monooxygenase [Kocuria dechangensis]|uniref:2,4-dichlorophenol 6-monooxygenase n=1 Tax=Kocuria dechangensis TaxID=1176249 RepID=A0A917GZ95_9MICC|nr:FAD-dependent monooxygenase [Kocuria dechangensis]GGG61483.1 2,4-dichlorophenol 6-monooxygenase [Kocuria dechangensis]
MSDTQRLVPSTTVEPGDITTDVLIVGSGPAGSSAALFLASYGIEHLVINKYASTADTPRAHITNQRTVEIMRDMGIEDQIEADATPHPMIGETVFCTSIAGEELGRVRAWGTSPARHADYEAASPSMNCDLPQTYFEPILVRNAMARGSKYRWSTEYLTLTQDQDGVHALVRDRLSGQTYTIHAQYLIGADGSRSKVAADLQLPMEGRMGRSGSMNIVCEMDLAPYCQNRESVLYWVLQPGAAVGGIGLGLVRMVRPWNKWLITWGYDIDQAPPELTKDSAAEIVRNLIGDPTLEIEVESFSLWTVNEMYATRNMADRVFCVGDAVHRHPPSNGLGSNTSIGDSYNLAWKLAHVLKGLAGPELLATYNDERVPVGEQIVTRANKSIDEFGAILEALGIDPRDDTATMQAQIATRKDATEEGEARREALRQALVLKNYEFNALGVELGQRYASAAVVGDGSPFPAPVRDAELYYQPTTHPGARLPHAWLGTADPTAPKVSTHDVCGHGRFTVLTGINGAAWAEAAREVAAATGVQVEAHVIGPGQHYEDLYGDWARQREHTDAGAILVRPDNHIAYRSMTMVEDPRQALEDALSTVLCRRSPALVFEA